MWIRITIDADMNIHDAVAVTDAGPFAPCGDITPKFAALKGKRIGRGWLKGLRDAIGGPNGCTHQWELLGRVAARGGGDPQHGPRPGDSGGWQRGPVWDTPPAVHHAVAKLSGHKVRLEEALVWQIHSLTPAA